MRKKLLTIICFSILGFSASAQTGIHVPELQAFDAAVLNLMSTYNVPGGQLAISYKGRLVYNRGFGMANTAAQDSVYPGSLFRIASVSKTITGIACMKLFEQGLLSLDAKVFGPEGILNDAIYQNIIDPRYKDISVRMLLQHSGGFDRYASGDPMFQSYYIAYTMGVASPPPSNVIVQYMLSHMMLDFAPGTKYEYSNFGYCVLGRVIEKITGQSYEDHVRSALLNPLGIAATQLGFNMLADRVPGEVNYYDFPGAPYANSIYDNTTQVPWPYGGFDVEAMDAHGGWISSGEDLLKLVCAIDRFDTRPDILTHATIDTMTKPSANRPNYACGISVNQYNIWWHMGSLPGTTSGIVRNGNKELNWAFLYNTRDESGNINAAADNLVWNVLPSITSWPDFDLFTESTIGIDKISAKAEFELYPNPASEKLTISFTSIHQKEISLKIYNAFGQEVYSQQIPNETKTIDISHFTDGMYFVRAITDKQIYDKKIIVKNR